MKKLLAFLLAVSLVFCGVLFASCGNDVPREGTMIVVVRSETDAVYNADLQTGGFTTKSTVADILAFLKETQGLPYSESGGYLNSVGSLNPDTSCEFVEVFTSVEKDFGVWDGVATIQYSGILLTAAGVGINQCSLKDGAVILFKITAFV